MDLFEAVGLTLWWAEGTKLRADKRRKNGWIYAVEITNTDPVVISTFLKYLRIYLGVQNSRIKLQLHIHEGDDQKELEDYWEKITGVPRSQFNKTIIRAVGNKLGKNKGTCKIRIFDKVLYLEMANRLDKLRGVGHR